MHVDQLLRDKPLKTAFGITEGHWKQSKTHRVSFFRLKYIFCGFFRENCCLNFDLIITPYKLLNHACMVACVTYALVTCAFICCQSIKKWGFVLIQWVAWDQLPWISHSRLDFFFFVYTRAFRRVCILNGSFTNLQQPKSTMLWPPCLSLASHTSLHG